MRGIDIAKRSGCRIVIGENSDTACYSWQHRVIVLPPRVAFGSDAFALVVAAEETAHSRQPAWALALGSNYADAWAVIRWAMIVFRPVRHWLEADAFAQAKEILA